MTVEITTLEQPIDAMYLIHKALLGETRPIGRSSLPEALRPDVVSRRLS